MMTPYRENAPPPPPPPPTWGERLALWVMRVAEFAIDTSLLPRPANASVLSDVERAWVQEFAREGVAAITTSTDALRHEAAR